MATLLNKLTLGTVQFGMDYGINNPNGKPSLEKSLEMLDFAWAKGIRIFDTAYNYGEAEEILGEFVKTRNPGAEMKIITKLKPNILSEEQGRTSDIIENNLKASLKRLNRDYVDGYLFHTPAYIYNKEAVEAMISLKKKDLVKNIGVSIYEEKDAVYAAKIKEFDYIQVPYSIFDQRVDRVGFFEIARKNNIKVFARSAFLQGLFFMPEDKIPSHLEIAKPYFKKFDEIIGKYGLSRQQVAVLFTHKNEAINHLVFGVDNLEQLKEDIEIAERNMDCEDCLKELRENFINVEKSIIFPSLWKK
ncbi:MAG: aldo/keto reductase [Candidatus Zambryskibacteria bacterium]